MTALNIVLAILLFLAAIFLIVAVLIQSGKDKGVSGAITGGSSETYYGRNKGKSKDKKLSLITTIVAIVFVLLAIVAYITQPYTDEGDYWERVFGIGDYSKPATSTVASSTTGSSDKNTAVDSSTAASSDKGSDDVDTNASTNDSTTGEPSDDVQSSTPASESDDVQSSDTSNSSTADEENN